LKLEVHGRLDGRLTIHGQRVDKNRVLRLGPIRSGDAVRETVVMKVNDERHGLTVQGVETDPDFLRARLVPFDSSATTGLYRLEVAIPADAPTANCMGEQAATVRLRTDHPRLPWIELKVDFAILQGGAGHVRVAHGKAVKVATKGSDNKPAAGVTARLDGDKVLIAAAGNARPGLCSVLVFSTTGNKADVKVNVKRAVARR
jgi:hypothetical protein